MIPKGRPSQGGPSSLAEELIRWQKRHGRHDLPWQNARDAYAVWLSEIMLQQTQVATVIPYYRRFLSRFPDVHALAAASQQEVMELWSGLGYYSRARNLHNCAHQVVAEHGGVFPEDPEALARLPGIGRSTAAAIAAFAYGRRAAILDGNVVRVFSRIFGIDGYAGSKPVKDRLWRLAEELLPLDGIQPYTQGLMDLGATVCTRARPTCASCPLAARCVALATGRTAELPAKKPKRELPQKAAIMLVVTHAGRVLLEQRPQLGIWGGLLSLPELSVGRIENELHLVEETTLVQVAAPFGEIVRVEPLVPFTHTFSHFRLHVLPYRVMLAQAAHMAAQSKHVWWELDDIDRAPLPTPVKRLLGSMGG